MGVEGDRKDPSTVRSLSCLMSGSHFPNTDGSRTRQGQRERPSVRSRGPDVRDQTMYPYVPVQRILEEKVPLWCNVYGRGSRLPTSSPPVTRLPLPDSIFWTLQGGSCPYSVSVFLVLTPLKSVLCQECLERNLRLFGFLRRNLGRKVQQCSHENSSIFFVV